MQYIWNPTLDDVIEAMELAKSRGVKPGESYEKEFLEVMAKKNKKHSGVTELNRDELLTELTQKNKKILNVETDSQGHQTYKVVKKQDNIEE